MVLTAETPIEVYKLKGRKVHVKRDDLVVDEKGNELSGACEGRLCMSDSWPGQMRTVYGDHQRFIDTYFST